MNDRKTNTPVAQHSPFYTSAGVDIISTSTSLNEKAASQKRALISFGSIAALIGFILSGPVGFLFVQLVKPLPAWTTAANFAAQYNPLQNIPYYFGFILIGGMLILAVAHYLNADNELPLDKMHVLLSVIWTTIFAAFVFFNYICQIAFIHHLATDYKPDNDTAISTLSMANPASLSWTVEMWGYAILGVSTWLLSAYYRNKNRTIHFLLTANGIVSILSAGFFVYDGKWLLTIIGLASYFLWNMLMIVLLILIYRHSKQPNYETTYCK
jgi:hypothetical protein